MDKKQLIFGVDIVNAIGWTETGSYFDPLVGMTVYISKGEEFYKETGSGYGYVAMGNRANVLDVEPACFDPSNTDPRYIEFFKQYGIDIDRMMSTGVCFGFDFYHPEKYDKVIKMALHKSLGDLIKCDVSVVVPPLSPDVSHVDGIEYPKWTKNTPTSLLFEYKLADICMKKFDV